MEPIPTPESPAAPPEPQPAAPAVAGSPGPPLAVLLALAAGFLPALILFGVSVWSLPAYRFFPLGVVACGLVGWLGGRRESAPRLAGPAWLTGGLLTIALLLLAGSWLLGVPWLGAAGAVMALPAVANWVGGLPLVRAWLPAWWVALVLLPPPLGLAERLVDFLRGVVVVLARPLLGQFNVLHVIRSDSIEVSGRVIPLADACAGLYLMPAGMVLALVLTSLPRRGPWHGLIVALTIPVWTLLATVGWCLLGLRQASRGGLDLFGGLGGIVVGGVVLLGLGILALSMDQLLLFFTESRRAALMRLLTPAPAARPRRAVAATGLGWAVAAAFGLVGLGQAAVAAMGWLDDAPVELARPGALPPSVSLPPEIMGWRLLTNRFSAMDDLVAPTKDAQIWHFARGELAASFSLEQMLAGYESLAEAYRRAGWRTLATVDYRAGTNAATPFLSVAMQKDIFQYGRIWQAVGSYDGQWLAPPPPEGRRGWFGRPDAAAAPTTFRLQQFVSSLEPLTAEELDNLDALFQTVRQQVAAQVSVPTEINHAFPQLDR